jgi:hypothetical protein
VGLSLEWWLTPEPGWVLLKSQGREWSLARPVADGMMGLARADTDSRSELVVKLVSRTEPAARAAATAELDSPSAGAGTMVLQHAVDVPCLRLCVTLMVVRRLMLMLPARLPR